MYFSGVRPATWRNRIPAASAISVNVTAGRTEEGIARAGSSAARMRRQAKPRRRLEPSLAFNDCLQCLKGPALPLAFVHLAPSLVENGQVVVDIGELGVQGTRLLKGRHRLVRSSHFQEALPPPQLEPPRLWVELEQAVVLLERTSI